MSALLAMAIVSLGVVLVGVAGALALRRHVRQDPRPARVFVALGVAVTPIALVMVASTGMILAGIPVAAVSALCLAAGWSFHPRFADFERAFREYAAQHARPTP